MSQNYATIFGNHILFTNKQNIITFGLSKFQLPSSKSMGDIYVADSPLECLIPEFKSPQIGGVEIRSGDIVLSKNKIIDNKLNLENNASNYLGATVYQNDSPVGMIQKGGSLLSTALISSLLLTGCQLIDLEVEQDSNLETVHDSTIEAQKSNEWIFASPELHPNDDCVTEDKMFKADNQKPMELIGQLLTESSETAKQIKNVIIDQDKQMCQEYDNKFENTLMEMFNERLLTLEKKIYAKSQELLTNLSNKDGVLADMERSYIKSKKQNGGMSLLQPILLLTAASTLSGCLSMETDDKIKPDEEINQNIFKIMHKNLKKIDLEFIEQFKIKEKQLNSNNKTLGVINNQLNDTILLNQSDQILNQMLFELEKYKVNELHQLLHNHKNDIMELEEKYKEKRTHCAGFKSEKTLPGIIVATD